MGKLSQASSQEKLQAFFREIVLGEPGVDKALAERVAERCVRHIDLLLEWDRSRVPERRDTTGLSPAPDRSLVPPLRASTPMKPAMRTFDPYAFSVVVTLVKKGREALVARLSEIDDVDDLRQLANAQHLGVDPHLARPEDVRQAIVSGAEQRIAGRRAAAS